MFMHSKVQVDRAEKDIFILEWYITTEGLFSSKSETKKQCISFSRGRQLNNIALWNILCNFSGKEIDIFFWRNPKLSYLILFKKTFKLILIMTKKISFFRSKLFLIHKVHQAKFCGLLKMYEFYFQHIFCLSISEEMK